MDQEPLATVMAKYHKGLLEEYLQANNDDVEFRAESEVHQLSPSSAPEPSHKNVEVTYNLPGCGLLPKLWKELSDAAFCHVWLFFSFFLSFLKRWEIGESLWKMLQTLLSKRSRLIPPLSLG